MIENILVRRAVCKNNLFKCFNSMGHNGFPNNVSITLIDNTDGKNPKKREDYRRRTLKTYSPLDLMLNTVSDQAKMRHMIYLVAV